MRIVYDRPPNFDKLDAAFNIGDKPVIFAYGDTIYNPTRGKITSSLIEHEFIHCAQQGTDQVKIEQWWDRYIADPRFRYLQELPAHIAEYRHYRRRHVGKKAVSYLEHVAEKLASGLYGNLVTKAKARNDIITGEVSGYKWGDLEGV